jgi:hypothetical protein
MDLPNNELSMTVLMTPDMQVGVQVTAENIQTLVRRQELDLRFDALRTQGTTH